MEVKFPPTGAFNVNTNSVAGASRNVGVESFTSSTSISQADKQEDFEQEDILRDVMKRTADLLSIGDRGLKFEMIEDADIYQLQVIDMTDGRVVRKIPPDEVVKVIAHLKEQLSDHVDVFA